MAHRLRITAAIPVALTIFACSETPFRFFDWSDIPGEPGSSGGAPSAGGACDDSCSSGGFVESSGGQAGDASGAGPSDGGGASDPCLLAGGTQRAERIQITNNGLCLARGAFQLLLGDESYTIAFAECSSDPAQIWVISEFAPELLEIRNYSVDLNLDAQFASVEPGTPIDLFEPHQLYNQRFVVTDNGDGSFKLSPLNGSGMCLSTWNNSLILRACDPSFLGQSFRRLECEP